MKCLLLGHRNRQVGYEEYYDVSFGDNMPRTSVFLTCERCGKRSTKELDGHWGRIFEGEA